MSQHFDAIVIGTGQSGPSLAVKLAGPMSRVPGPRMSRAMRRISV
jgi:choline dehydrogenase-like flavoprotein